ncbi:hypothetical protein EU538_08535 [Candidatus Thorarchaeota archaeon]|nr:MAG: hypothetical protein EU538_08535 [Candidatus Thorarchaeota archaeon]
MRKYSTVLVLLLIVFGMGANFTVMVQAGPIPMESPLSETADNGRTSDIEHFEIPLTLPNMTMSENGSVFSVRTLHDSQGQMVESYGRSITIIVTVPSLWTRTEYFYVQFDVYLDGYVYADLDFVFEGFDNFFGCEEREVYSSASDVRIDGPTDDYSLECYLAPSYSVGLKRAEVQVSGMAYYKSGGITPDGLMTVEPEAAPGMSWDWVSRGWEWDYEFVARYGPADLQTYGGLPPSDSMTATSQNPDYYWEGMPDDGYNIFTQYALHRCTEPAIVYQAGFLVDNEWSEPASTAEIMHERVWMMMDYYKVDDTTKTTNADMWVYNHNWRGVCDEYSAVLASFLRVIGLPSRYLVGFWFENGDCHAHAWNEVWTGQYWIHADATWNEYNNPSCYNYAGIIFDWVQINSCADDSIGTWTSYDGSDTNGKLDGNDWQWEVLYDYWYNTY